MGPQRAFQIGCVIEKNNVSGRRCLFTEEINPSGQGPLGSKEKIVKPFFDLI